MQKLRIALCAVCLIPVGVNATTVLTDTEFNDADWALNKVSEVGGTITASQAPNINRPETGNLGDYRVVKNEGVGPQPPTIFLAATHFNSALTYNPSSQGAITGIDFSLDYRNFSQGQALQFGLEQNGTLAFSSVFVTTASGTGTWLAHALSVTAVDFPTIDFDSTGSQITFGFRTANSGQVGVFETGYDNYSAVISSVPVPAAVWLFGSGLLGLVGMARSKKA